MRAYDRRVYFFFDESGDFAFPREGFDCYVQAALICPDSALTSLEAAVADLLAKWGLRELHAAELSPEQRLEVARRIGQFDCQLLAHVTDNTLVTVEKIEQFRLDQAAALERNLAWYRRESTKARGAPVPQIKQWMLRQIKRAGLASQISHSEFVQAHYMLELVADALQKSLLTFYGQSQPVAGSWGSSGLAGISRRRWESPSAVVTARAHAFVSIP
jgi:hypothetical protein